MSPYHPTMLQHRQLILATILLLTALFSGRAFTQTQGAQLEEVIVTAQRREENLQDVAVSVTVVGEEAIANANMMNSGDIATYVPSLTTNARFGNEMTSFAIRGFTQDLRTAASVGVYFAEVVAPRGAVFQVSGDGAGPGALFDLQNIQVLKGPQGTLFGRNTTGGSILLVPNRPEENAGGHIEVSGGDFSTKRLQAVANIPVNDRLRIRLGIDRNERDGHLTNITGIGANTLADSNYLAARLSSVWDINDSLENYTILSYADTESNGYTARLFNCNPDQTNPFYSFIGGPCLAQLEQQKASGQDGFYDVVSTVGTPITTIKEQRFINTTVWEINDRLTLKNILAWSHLEGLNGSDNFGTRFTENAANAVSPTIPLPFPTLSIDPRREFHVGVNLVNPDFPTTSQKAWIEELQLQGTGWDSRLIWQAGLYYEHSQPDGRSGNTSASLLFCDMRTLESANVQDYNCNDPLGGQIGGVLHTAQRNDFLNKAVYAQASFDLLDSLTVTAGIRHTKDRAKGVGERTRYAYLGTVQQAPIFSTSSPEVESEAPTGLLELSYRPLQDVMLYGKYIRGYRQGSINLAADPGLDTHQHETVDTYELGAKTTFDWPVPVRLFPVSMLV